MGQAPAVAAAAAEYLHIAGWMIVPALVIALLRSFLSALERTAVLLWITLGAGVLNALWGYAMIFGAWGLPELGIVGAAWAALLTNTASAILLGAYALWRLPEYRLLQRHLAAWTAPRSRGVFRLGWPIGGQLLAEVGLFAGLGHDGGLGRARCRSPRTASRSSSPRWPSCSTSGCRRPRRCGPARPSAAATREGLRQGAVAAVALSAGFALLTMVVFLLWPAPLLGLFVDPADPAAPEVIRVGVTLLALAAAFSLFDGAQVVAIGLLRGIQDTTVPMIMAGGHLLGGGAARCAYVLGFVLGGDEVGVWLGLVASLVCRLRRCSSRGFWRRAARGPPSPPQPDRAPTLGRTHVRLHHRLDRGGRRPRRGRASWRSRTSSRRSRPSW